jgi:hypothetical protein
MAISKHTAPAGAHSVEPNERSDARIHAFVASMRPLRGCVFGDDIQEANRRGRTIIERLALSAKGGAIPRLLLSCAEVADVLSFIHCSEPVEPATWWRDIDAEVSHTCGYTITLEALEKSLRAIAADREDTGQHEKPELPPGLADYLLAQQDRMNELAALLRLAADSGADMPLALTCLAERVAGEVAAALDDVAIREVLAGARGTSA